MNMQPQTQEGAFVVKPLQFSHVNTVVMHVNTQDVFPYRTIS
jgi:hypothetical protein